MKKVIIGIFAHPDDEAFLPSGSLIKWVDNGADLHLICVTRGERGQNPDNIEDLGAQRCEEWKVAGKLIGAISQLQLDYPDGGLGNNLFHEIADKISESIESITKKYDRSLELDLITYENCGITGHLDHVAVSFITSYVYARLAREGSVLPSTTRLLYACACEAISPKTDTSFVFMPKGHVHDDIDMTEDVSGVLDRKIAVMQAHHSQRSDADNIITQLGDNIVYEHFNVFKG